MDFQSLIQGVFVQFLTKLKKGNEIPQQLLVVYYAIEKTKSLSTHLKLIKIKVQTTHTLGF